ncbi:hypothetical protein [Streptomyces sp. NPDC002032]
MYPNLMAEQAELAERLPTATHASPVLATVPVETPSGRPPPQPSPG